MIMRMFAASILVLLSVSAAAQDFPDHSLFFMPDEEKLIVTAAHAGHIPAKLITLDAITFVSPARWTVWLDQKQWTPDSSDGTIKIIYVSASEVSFEWRGGTGKDTRRVTLLTTQAYDPVNDRVIDHIRR